MSGSSEELDETESLHQVEEISGGVAPTQERAELEPPTEDYALWAWPLNEDGFVRAWSKKDKFTVALDFKYLLSRDAEVSSIAEVS